METEETTTAHEVPATVTTGVDDISLAVADLKVTDEVSMTVANNHLATVKSLLKELEKKRKEIVQPWNDSVKKVNDLFKSPKETLTACESNVRDKMNAFLRDQRQAEQDESDRLAREEKEEADRIALAQKKTFFKKKEEPTPPPVEPTPTPPPTTFTPGATMHTRTDWKFEVVDIAKLIHAVHIGAASPDLVLVNETKLQNMATVMKNDAPDIPGVRFYPEESIVSRK